MSISVAKLKQQAEQEQGYFAQEVASAFTDVVAEFNAAGQRLADRTLGEAFAMKCAQSRPIEHTTIIVLIVGDRPDDSQSTAEQGPPAP